MAGEKSEKRSLPLFKRKGKEKEGNIEAAPSHLSPEGRRDAKVVCLGWNRKRGYCSSSDKGRGN